MRQVAVRLETALTEQRGHLFPWVPVALATGIGLYFGLPEEPPVYALGMCCVLCVAVLFLSRWLRVGRAPLAIAAGLILCGIALAGARAHMVLILLVAGVAGVGATACSHTAFLLRTTAASVNT